MLPVDKYSNVLDDKKEAVVTTSFLENKLLTTEKLQQLIRCTNVLRRLQQLSRLLKVLMRFTNVLRRLQKSKMLKKVPKIVRYERDSGHNP